MGTRTPEEMPPTSSTRNARGDRIWLFHLITGLSVGGAERMLLQVLPRLDRARYEVVVCSLTKSGPVGEHLREQGFEVLTLGAQGATGQLRALRRLACELRRRRVDVLHAHLFHANIAARLTGRLSRVPVVITDERDIGSWKSPVQLAIERLTARLCDQVTAVSEAAGEWAVTRQGVPRRKLQVVRNGVALPPPAAGREELRRRLRAEFGLPRDAFVVLSAGRIDPVKGYEYLVEAAATVRATSPQVYFVVVGGVADKDVGYRERLLTQAAGLGVAEAVVLEGRRDDVPDLMRGADLLALPSLSEGLPNAVLEAMAAGLPVVATAVGGCCELGENGRTLRLVPARDAGALAAAITALRRSAELRESLAEAARDFVAEHHSWERTVRELDELYAELLCRKSPRRARALGLVGAR